MADQFSDLNEQQFEAVTLDPDTAAIVVAAPGSGKTRVITDRLVYLIQCAGVDPRGIAVTTFTRKAADEMRMRAAAKLGEKINRVRLGTIHSLCLGILREEGIVKTQEILKTWEAKRVLSDTIQRFPATEVGYKYPLTWISKAKAGCVYPDQGPEWFYATLVNLTGDESTSLQVGEMLSACYFEYEKYKESNSKIDFSDMLMMVEALLVQSDDFRHKWQNAITHVMVDEAQDTGSQSYRILRMLAEPDSRMFVVGDPDQELYRWAGASPDENIYGFRNFYPQGRIILLETNYRSTRTIVDATNKVIQANYEFSDLIDSPVGPGSPGPRKGEFRKVVRPSETAPEGMPISYKEYEDSLDEALGLSDSIQTQINNEGRNPGDFFVIYRTNAQSRQIEEALMRRKIPFVVQGGEDFFDRKAVKDILSYIQVAHDPTNDEAFERVINIASASYQYATRRIGKKLMEEIRRETNGKMSLHEAFMCLSLSAFYSKARADYLNLTADIAGCATPAEAVNWTRKACYEAYLIREEGIDEADAIEQGTFEILDELTEFAKNFDSIQAMFDYIAWIRSIRQRQSKDVAHAVVLTTIHKVKGLERPVVYGVGLIEGLLPHALCLGSGGMSEGLPLDTDTGIEDERCAMYVLVSRAKEELHLSSVHMYREQEASPSRFLYEIGVI